MAAAQPGTAGSIRIESIGSTAALKMIGSIVSAQSSRSDYDYRLLLHRARVDESVVSLVPQDLLTFELGRSLARSQTRLLESLRALIQGASAPLTPLVDPIVAGIQVSHLGGAGLTHAQEHLLADISAFSVDPTETVKEYFTRIGGAFNPTTLDVQGERYTRALARIDAGITIQLLGSIDAQLLQINRQMFDFISATRLADLKRQADEIKRQIEAAKAEAEKASNPFNVVSDLAMLGKHVADLYAAYQTSNPVMAAEALRGISEDYYHLSHASEKLDAANATLAALIEALQAMNGQIASLLNLIRDVNAEQFAQRMNALQRTVEARSALQSRILAKSALYPDLLRVALLGYVIDPARNRQVLEANLTALGVFAALVPQQEPSFRLADIEAYRSRVNCSARGAGCRPCTTLKPATTQRVLTANVTFAAGKPVEIPIYVVAPNTSELKLILYGLCLSDLTPPAVGWISDAEAAESDPPGVRVRWMLVAIVALILSLAVGAYVLMRGRFLRPR